MTTIFNSDDLENIDNAKRLLKKFVTYQSNNKSHFIASKKASARHDYNGPLVAHASIKKNFF